MRTPRFLLGAGLLFWGVETQQLVLAAILAGAVEASGFVKIRWRFSDIDFSRIADLCLLGIIGLFAYRIMTGWYAQTSWFVVQWMPVVLSPLLLAQQYSTETGVNLNALFLFQRRKKKTNGLRERRVELSFAYLAVCLIAAGAANHRTPFFYAAILMLTGWALWCVKPGKGSKGVWVGLLLLAAVCGYGIQLGLSSLQSLIMEAGMDWFVNSIQQGRDPYRTFTHMGDIGDIKLSGRILFRVKPGGWDPGSLLLREASYDTYLSGAANWFASGREFLSVPRNRTEDAWNIMPNARPDKRCTVSFPLKKGKGLLKLPNSTAKISDLTVEAMSLNRLGTLKVEGKGLVTYTAHYGSAMTPGDLSTPADRVVPDAEAGTIQQIVGDLSLKSLPPSEALIAISRFLKGNFSYSLEQKESQGRGTILENFLTGTKSGHCEFFATAAVLLLRGAGIPARYVTGYAVDTWDKMGGWCLIRARHAHAWALACVDGRWVDLDATPGAWLEKERAQASRLHQLSDLWSWFSFGFSKWRSQQDGSSGKRYLTIILVALLVLMVIRIFSKKRGQQIARPSEKTEARSTIQRGKVSGFYPIEARLNEMGYYRQESETVASWIDCLKDFPDTGKHTEILRELMALHYRCRFNPEAFTPNDDRRMISLTGKWLEENKEGSSPKPLE